MRFHQHASTNANDDGVAEGLPFLLEIDWCISYRDLIYHFFMFIASLFAFILYISVLLYWVFVLQCENVD